MKKIDLSCIVGSQVLCEFSEGRNYDDWNIVDFLESIDDYGAYHAVNCCAEYKRCSIKRDIWFANPNGKLVLPDGLNLDLTLRGGIEMTGISDEFSFTFDKESPEVDIIAVKVTDVAEGWSYE